MGYGSRRCGVPFASEALRSRSPHRATTTGSTTWPVLGFFLMLAAKSPREHGSLISFVVWSSVVHALIMAVQAIGDESESGYLVGDVPALLLVAAVLGFLTSRKEQPT